MGGAARGTIRAPARAAEVKLFPRLPDRFAQEVFAAQSSLPFEQIAGASSHRFMIWPATGADRIGEAELLTLAERLRDVAIESGYPGTLARGDQNALDLALARVLWQTANLSVAEAGFGDVWSFLALVLVPDIVWWRAAGSTNIERFVATDLTRHTLARLWWRAQLFTWGLDDPEEGWDLWESSTIGEAELDQIQTRRGGYGRSPRAFRSLVRVYPSIVALADQVRIDRRTLWRQSYLRWILRLGAFTDFAGMPESELREDLLALAHEVAAAAAAPSPQSAGSSDEERPGTNGERDAETPSANGERKVFDALPLSTLVVHLTDAVRAGGEVARDDLGAAFEHSSGIAVPRARVEILAGIAWQGQRLHYLVHTGGETTTIWQPGPVLPAPDRRWGDWSIDSFKKHVASLDGAADLDTLCAELFNGRAGTTVKRIVKTAVKETRR
jgi:hypothetical protein